MRLAATHLKAVCPQANATVIECVLRHWDDTLLRFGITDRTEILQLLAHVCVETWALRALSENLAYNPDGIQLWKVYGRAHFKSPSEARRVAAMGAKAIAEKVYGGRFGNTQAGFGWRYRGQGLIDLTFRDNYAAVGRMCGIDLVGHPELSQHPDSALSVACGYWQLHKVGPAARRDDLRETTKLVQGGSGGLPDREAYLGRIKRLLYGVDVTPIRPKQGKTMTDTPAQPATTPAAAPGSLSLPNDLVAGIINLLFQKAKSGGAASILASLDLTQFSAQALPAPSWINGKKTYIASIAGAISSISSAAILYSNGKLTLGMAIAGAATFLSAFGGVAAIRSAITAHFGAIGGAVVDLIASFLEQLETQQTPK